VSTGLSSVSSPTEVDHCSSLGSYQARSLTAFQVQRGTQGLVLREQGSSWRTQEPVDAVSQLQPLVKCSVPHESILDMVLRLITRSPANDQETYAPPPGPPPPGRSPAPVSPVTDRSGQASSYYTAQSSHSPSYNTPTPPMQSQGQDGKRGLGGLLSKLTSKINQPQGYGQQQYGGGYGQPQYGGQPQQQYGGYPEPGYPQQYGGGGYQQQPMYQQQPQRRGGGLGAGGGVCPRSLLRATWFANGAFCYRRRSDSEEVCSEAC